MYKKFLNNSFVKSSIFIGWSSLGFYRGIQKYNYDFQKNIEYYETNKNKISNLEKPEQFYFYKFFFGISIGFVYITPIICLLPAIKEIYRLEVNIRSLEDKKKSKDYYDIFFFP